MTALELKDRIFGAGHRILTVLGAVGGALAALGQWLEYIPPDWRSNKWYAVAVALVALGAALKLPEKKDPKGFIAPAILVAVILGAAVALLAPRMARADEPKFGGCVGSTCFAPAVSVNVVAMRLKSGDLTSTFDPGIGYGMTAYSDRWYRVGVSTTIAFPTLDGARRAQPALTFSFAEYARLGVACPLYVRGGFPENGMLLLGFGADFGRW